MYLGFDVMYLGSRINGPVWGSVFLYIRNRPVPNPTPGSYTRLLTPTNIYSFLLHLIIFHWFFLFLIHQSLVSFHFSYIHSLFPFSFHFSYIHSLSVKWWTYNLFSSLSSLENQQTLFQKTTILFIRSTAISSSAFSSSSLSDYSHSMQTTKHPKSLT